MSCLGRLCFAVLAWLIVGTSSRDAAAEIARVWAIDDGTKIKATELAHPLAAGNGTFSGKTVKLFGLRNETIAFQVILEGGNAPTEGVVLRFSGVGPIHNEESMRDDPDAYWLDRRIEVFEQRYLDVTLRSHDMSWKPWSGAQPADLTGRVPDPLVPHNNPVTVPARQNKGMWVDVYIPKDAPAGTHRDELTVVVGGEPFITLAVDLEIADVSMPDETATKTMVWFSGGENNRDVVAARYFDDPWNVPDEQIAALRRRHFFLARRHRITLFIGEDDAPRPEMKARLDGSWFSRELGYDGPGVSVPQDVYSIHTYGGKLDASQATDWDDWFAQHAPNADFFLYVTDEPQDPAVFPDLNAIARAAAPVPAFVTHAYDDRLSFDIFCAPASLYSPATAKAVADTKKVWIYNGYLPNTGSFVTDDVAISPRVNPWIQHKFKIPRWFYWEATYYKDVQGGRGNIDVFGNANNFRVGDEDKMNGDGLLMYPGRDRIFKERDLGIDAPLPSIRLKNWRRGIQDVEYLLLVAKAGHAEFADQLVQALIPAALADQTIDGDPVSWPEDGEKWLEARRLLFDTLTAGTPPTTDLARLTRPPEALWPKYKRELKRWLDPLIRTPKRRLVSGAAAALSFAFALFVALRWRRRRSKPVTEKA